MNTSHTPGPWVATTLDGYGRFEIHAHNGGRAIAKSPNGYGDASTAETNEANARLIAAAPELLAALQLYFANDSRFHKAASDAIAKATTP
jgi:hypothetical protein